MSLLLLVMSEREVNAASVGKFLLKKNVNISCQKICYARLSIEQISLFFHFLNVISLLLFVISERVVNAPCAEKLFAGKVSNLLLLLITARMSMEQISMQLLIKKC